MARETRGLVHLKLGDPAIAVAEYQAALQIDPSRARALYGLGLAKRRMDWVTEGRTGQAAALALLPPAASEFSLYGGSEPGAVCMRRRWSSAGIVRVRVLE